MLTWPRCQLLTYSVCTQMALSISLSLSLSVFADFYFKNSIMRIILCLMISVSSWFLKGYLSEGIFSKVMGVGRANPSCLYLLFKVKDAVSHNVQKNFPHNTLVGYGLFTKSNSVETTDLGKSLYICSVRHHGRNLLTECGNKDRSVCFVSL